MQPKFIAAAIALTLGLSLPCLAAGDPPAPAGGKRLARQSSEDLLARTVFQTLVAEFALRQGDVKLGSDAWTDLAQRTRDPQAIARATEVAGFAKQYDRALELTKLWLAVEPDSAKARQAQSSLLVLTNRIGDLGPQLAALLVQDKDNLGNNLLHLNRMLARLNDPKAVQQLVNRLAEPYPDVPEAHFAMSQAAANAGDMARALGEAEQALRLRPNWETAALIRAQLQSRESSEQAIGGLAEFVGRNPQAQEARMNLARLLVGERRYEEARHHFERLLADNPDNLEIIYPVAMLALQQGDAKTGREQLERLLSSEFQDKATVHFLLGQLDQEQNKLDEALAHFRQVTSGEQYIAARSRAAQVLVQQGKLDEARAMLHATRGASAAQQVQLSLAEAQILREANRLNDAYIVLELALSQQPENVDLLYDAALTAERIDKPELLEMHLARLLELKPDHSHALNALGYSWAERNIRLDEARELIAKALSLTPDDPFIVDSLGWVLYRLGRLDESLGALERAYRLRADPEIAAHLGEVLWQLGRKDDARKLIREALRSNPENSVLAATAKKLLP